MTIRRFNFQTNFLLHGLTNARSPITLSLTFSMTFNEEKFREFIHSKTFFVIIEPTRGAQRVQLWLWRLLTEKGWWLMWISHKHWVIIPLINSMFSPRRPGYRFQDSRHDIPWQFPYRCRICIHSFEVWNSIKDRLRRQWNVSEVMPRVDLEFSLSTASHESKCTPMEKKSVMLETF